jgi:hypothetical protein
MYHEWARHWSSWTPAKKAALKVVVPNCEVPPPQVSTSSPRTIVPAGHVALVAAALPGDLVDGELLAGEHEGAVDDVREQLDVLVAVWPAW